MANLTNVTSLTRNGLRDWLVQRATSIILAAYTLFILSYLLFHPHIDFYAWQNLFASPWMKIFSVLSLLSLILHAWVGMWTIATDYLKPVYLRLTFQIVMIVALLGYFFWGVAILWGGM